MVTWPIFIDQGIILLHYLAARPDMINTKGTKVKGEISKRSFGSLIRQLVHLILSSRTELLNCSLQRHEHVRDVIEMLLAATEVYSARRTRFHVNEFLEHKRAC